MNRQKHFYFKLFCLVKQFSLAYVCRLAVSGAITLGQSEPGSNGNEGVFLIPQSPSITGTSLSDSLVSYPGHSMIGGLTPLYSCSRCIYSPNRQGNFFEGFLTDFQKLYTRDYILNMINNFLIMS